MKILIYNWKDIKNPLVGGAEIITFEYARRLVSEGHEVTWFCRMVPGLPIEERIDGIKVVRRGSTFLTYWYGYRYYRSLQEKPDIVLDMLNTIAWQTPLYASKQSKVVQYVNQLAKEVWNYEMRPPFSWVGRLLEPIQLISYRRFPVVTYAESTADDLAAWGYDRDNIQIFRLGLDHDRYCPGEKAKYPLFIQVCRMVRMKRPDLTVKAFAQVVKRYPEARLALVGIGPFKPVLHRLIAELRISDKVIIPENDILYFNKSLNDQKVMLMQQAWALVHPSVKEGWGMVITEAAACGTLSIVSRVTGQVDAVKEGKTGIIVSKNPTVDEVAKAMISIIENKVKREKMQHAAIDWANELQWDTSYESFKKALERSAGIAL